MKKIIGGWAVPQLLKAQRIIPHMENMGERKKRNSSRTSNEYENHKPKTQTSPKKEKKNPTTKKKKTHQKKKKKTYQRQLFA